MSRLSVFWPDECESKSAAVADAPMILRFPGRAESEAPPRLDIVTRARLMFDNRRCRKCSYPIVEPIELDDALVNSNGREIPGTASLVGFQCRSCRATWSI